AQKVVGVKCCRRWNVRLDVGMHVYESGRDDAVMGIDRQPRMGKEEAPAAQANYLVIANGETGKARGAATAVNDLAVDDKNIQIAIGCDQQVSQDNQTRERDRERCRHHHPAESARLHSPHMNSFEFNWLSFLL